MAIEGYLAEVTLDISCNEPVEVVKAKQLDNLSRTIYASFVDETQEPISLTGATAEFRIQRPDGVLITSEASVAASGGVTVTLTEDMLAISGRAIADVRLFYDDTKSLSGGAFYIDIYQTAMGKPQEVYSGTQVNSMMVSKERFEAIPIKATNTAYYVTSDSGVELYLGDVPISGGGNSSQSAVKVTQVVPGVLSTGTAGEITESEEG